MSVYTIENVNGGGEGGKKNGKSSQRSCECPKMTCKLQEKNATFAPPVHTSLFLPKEDKLSHSMELLENNTAISIQTIVIFLVVFV